MMVRAKFAKFRDSLRKYCLYNKGSTVIPAPLRSLCVFLVRKYFTCPRRSPDQLQQRTYLKNGG